MSGLIHTIAYMRLSTADAYGVVFISSFSFSLVGLCFELSLKCPPSGVLTGFSLCMLNLSNTLSTYRSWDNHRSFFGLSRVIFIPRICLACPRSFIAKHLPKSFFNAAILLRSWATINISST
ncbi:hypothetical protein Bca4012_050220 [Brassica carinata]